MLVAVSSKELSNILVKGLEISEVCHLIILSLFNFVQNLVCGASKSSKYILIS